MTGKRWGIIGALALVLGVIAIAGLVFGNWADLGQSGPGTYPGSLLWAIPKAGASATFDDLSGRDASYLNSHNNGAYWECQPEMAPPCSSVLAPPPEIPSETGVLA
jgi:hypothetical protein